MTDKDIRTTTLPTSEGRQERETLGDDNNPCVVCGRDTDGRFLVFIGGGGHKALHPEDVRAADPEDIFDGGYLGAKPIGPVCETRLPSEFVFTTEGD